MRPVNKPSLKPVFLSAWIATTLLLLGLPSSDSVLGAGTTTHYRTRDLVRPFAFEEDIRQASFNPGFRVRLPGFTMMLSRDEIVWVERAPAEFPNHTVAQSSTGSPRIRMELVDSTPGVAPRGEGELVGRTTYIGVGPSAGTQPSTARNVLSVRYPNVYPGIDLRFHGDRQQLEFDFVVSPLADASRIQLRFTGADSLELGRHGELVLSLGSSVIRQHSPRIYQLVDGRQQSVEGRFQLGPDDRVSIEVDPSYDRSRELIIDPVLEFSTYWGGSSGDVPAAVAVDRDGYLYVAGSTGSTDFPSEEPGPGGIRRWRNAQR